MAVDTKTCEGCGNPFARKPKDSQSQWENRAFCSTVCSNGSKELEPLHVRFWNNVVRTDNNQCWFWIGAKDDQGYGRISFGGRSRKKDIKAHRLSYELRFGPIGEDKVICHACDTPSCVNPSHLYAGTQRDNLSDASRRGRLNEISRSNLRPGAPGIHGAGPRVNRETV